ncbi:hypothetical protein TNCV_4507811 [Trichonephila clavipes]|nr:hypothetical protein TNCV_4507811 [Trichonephila clavipes]
MGWNFEKGPILPDHLGSRYLIFLEQVLSELLEAHTLPLRLVLPCGSSKMEPSHISVFLFESLDATYGERWIGRGGPVHWPPRFPVWIISSGGK